jgi:hypothetical protein
LELVEAAKQRGEGQLVLLCVAHQVGSEAEHLPRYSEVNRRKSMLQQPWQLGWCDGVPPTTVIATTAVTAVVIVIAIVTPYLIPAL